MSSLTQRVISAVLMIGIMVTLFFLGQPALQIFSLICMIGIQSEIQDLLFLNQNKFLKYLRLSLTALATLSGPYIGFDKAVTLVALIGVGLDVLILPALKLKPHSSPDQAYEDASKFLLLVFYGVFIPSFVYKLIIAPNGMFWFSFLLFTTLGSDTCAFFAGRKFGKRPLAPTISPNKTVEGSIGGAIGAAIIALPFALLNPDTSFLALSVTALATGLLGQVGDLFESLLKRKAQVKDSGDLIPGHGGILDRVDGIIFAAPWVYCISVWL